MSEEKNVPDLRLLTRTEVAKKKNYSDYRDELRKDCCYSCVYCSIAELEAKGVGFEIDHYIPRLTFRETDPSLENDYYNLLYSCSVCNVKKGGYYPPDSEIAKKYYILRPDRDILDDHLKLEESTFTSITETGEFNIHKLSLNRSALKKLRGIRSRMYESQKVVAFGLSRFKELNFDNLPTSIRSKAFGNREKLRNKAELMDELIAEYTKSELVDKDGNQSEFEKERRAYLKKIKSMGI